MNKDEANGTEVRAKYSANPSSLAAAVTNIVVRDRYNQEKEQEAQWKRYEKWAK